MTFLYQTTITLLRGYFHLFHRYRIYGTTSPHVGKALLTPNHASFLDPPLIGAAWPEEVHFLARGSLFNSTLLGWLLPRLNAHPIHGQAQDIKSMRLIYQLLSEDKKVVIFPEGSRSETGQLQAIKPGVAMIALRMQCPIIPVYIHGTFEAWPKHKRRPVFGTSISCVFGKPIINLGEGEESNRKQAQEKLAQRIQKSLEELRLWFEEGANGPLP